MNTTSNIANLIVPMPTVTAKPKAVSGVGKTAEKPEETNVARGFASKSTGNENPSEKSEKSAKASGDSEAKDAKEVKKDAPLAQKTTEASKKPSHGFNKILEAVQTVESETEEATIPPMSQVDSQDSFEPLPVVSMAMAAMVPVEAASETTPLVEPVQAPEEGSVKAVPVKPLATAQETESARPASAEVVLNSGIVKKNTEEVPAEKNSVEEMPKKADSAATPEILPSSTKTMAPPSDVMSEKKPVRSNAAAENNPVAQTHAFSSSKAKPEIMAFSSPEVKTVTISEMPASAPRQAVSKEVPTDAVWVGTSSVVPASSMGSEAASVPAGQQIAIAVRSGVEQGEPRVVIRLDPPDLGEVSISISTRGSEVQAVVRVEHPETLKRLEQETPGLMQRLADAGIQVRRVELSLNNGSLSSDTSSGSMLRDQGNSSWQGQGQAFGSPRFGSGHFAEADSSSADGLPQAMSYATGDNQLNIWI